MKRAKSPLALIKEQIAEAVEGKEFCEVSEMVSQLNKKGIFKDGLMRAAIEFMKKHLVRQVMRRKGDDGYPLFPNIKMTDAETGKQRQVYMREKHMRAPQYRQVSEYWVGYADRGKRMANETIRRCNVRYGTQLEFPFPDDEASEAA